MVASILFLFGAPVFALIFSISLSIYIDRTINKHPKERSRLSMVLSFTMLIISFVAGLIVLDSY